MTTKTKDLSHAPHEVGNEVILVAGVQGIVQAVTEDTITINGHTLPRRLNDKGGVHYLSTMWPPPATVYVDDCDGSCGSSWEDEARITELRDAIEAAHYTDHAGAFKVCSHPLCRKADHR